MNTSRLRLIQSRSTLSQTAALAAALCTGCADGGELPLDESETEDGDVSAEDSEPETPDRAVPENGERADPDQVLSPRPADPSIEEGLGVLGVGQLAANQALIHDAQTGYEIRTFHEVDGWAVIDGDIILGDYADLIQGQRGVYDSGRAWPCGTVYYYFEDQGEYATTLSVRLKFRDGVELVNAATGVRFVELTKEPNAGFGFIRVKERHDGKNSGYAEGIGFQGGEQGIVVPDSFEVGNMAHEILHSLGLKHAHQQVDREDFVTYHDECVIPGKENSFDIYGDDPDEQEWLSTPYDYDSIMHYSSWQFCLKDEEDECVCPPLTLDPGYTCEIAECSGDEITSANREQLSQGDIDTVAALYDPVIPSTYQNFQDDAGHAIAHGDFNKDGYPDVVLGVPGMDTGATNAGGFEVFLGHEEGFTACGGMNQSGAGAVEAFDNAGRALATGDFDGDGYDDLAVGVPYEDHDSQSASNAGAISIYMGTDEGLSPDRSVLQTDIGWASEPSDMFGAALVAGDFDDDGDDELAVTSLYEASGSGPKEGYVAVLRRNGNGSWTRTQSLHQEMVGEVVVPGGGGVWNPAPLGDANDWERFGGALAAGDLNDDGIDDLIVGAPRDRVEGKSNVGSVYLFQADSDQSATFKPWIRVDQRSIGSDESGDYFGSSMAAIDFDGSGSLDLVVGAPGEDVGSTVNAGWLFLFRVESNNGIYDFSGAGQGTGSSEPHDDFGAAIACLSDDPDALFVVGSPGEQPQGESARTGMAFTFESGPGGPTAEDNITHADVLSWGLSSDEFGFALTAFEGGDWYGRDYVVVGAPEFDSDRGAAFVYRLVGGELSYLETLRRGSVTVDD